MLEFVYIKGLLVRDTSCPNCAFPPRLFAEHHACFVSEPTHLSRLVCSSTNPARDGAGLQGQGGPIPQPRPYTRFRTRFNLSWLRQYNKLECKHSGQLEGNTFQLDKSLSICV